jgi:hypothetical protein
VANVLSPSLDSSKPNMVHLSSKGLFRSITHSLDRLNAHLRDGHNILVSMKIVKGNIRYQVCEVSISCFRNDLN